MRSTFRQLAQFGTQFEGHHGLQTWTQLPDYDRKFQSKYGPSYKIARNFHGISLGRMTRFAITGAGFAGVAGIFALFLFEDVPRIRNDIMQQVPFIGDHFVKEVPPEDNPF